MNLVRTLGAAAVRIILRMGRMGIFLVLKKIQFIGFQSISVIFLTGGFTGMVLGYQGYNTLSRFGSDAFLALMVTGRAGSSVTAEIGIMRISEQIDALELMGLNPYRYLVVPNFWAAVISVPLLTAIFDVVGIFGGYLIGVKLLGVSSGIYFGEMISYVEMQDVFEGIFKSLNFGLLIAWVCCFKGYYTGYYTGFGAEGVSKATTQAVVLSSVLILVWDYFLTSTHFFF